MNSPILTYSNEKVTYNILDDLHVEITIEENVYSIPLDQLFLMAGRINKKRSFLFVSKVLGKHIPIKPEKGTLIGSLLACRYLEKKGEKNDKKNEILDQFFEKRPFEEKGPFITDRFQPIVIGFAETATALGHAFFEAFTEGDFYHTTRERLLQEEPVITFEEEHSHATSHRMYLPIDALKNNREIILVDDEITTGKTALNIIQSIHEKFPRKSYTVVSILDWRKKEDELAFKRLEEKLNISIETVSLLKGKVNIHGTISKEVEHRYDQEVEVVQNVSFHYIDGGTMIDHSSITADDQIVSNVPYIKETGRFGIHTSENDQIKKWTKEIGEQLKSVRKGKKTLVLGTGEFMYIPMRVAQILGEEVFYHSTTRSPIYPSVKEGYGIQNSYTFPNPEDPSIQHFVYNILPQGYDEIFICFEREVDHTRLTPLLKALKKSEIETIHVVFFSKKVGM